MDRVREVLSRLRAAADPSRLEGMGRFGIETGTALGVSIPELRKLSRGLGHDHELAAGLWATGIHEARILAGMVDDPAEVTEEQMEGWVRDFGSWDLCDQVCGNLFDRTPFAFRKAVEWAGREEEFVRRAGFAIMAWSALHDREAEDREFEAFLPLIEAAATDERNYVKKAVNWALRQIGKRNRALNRKAVAAAKRIQRIDSKAARWIAADALRELTSDAVQERLRR